MIFFFYSPKKTHKKIIFITADLQVNSTSKTVIILLVSNEDDCMPL